MAGKGKVSLIHLFPDLTCEEHKKSTYDNHVKVDKYNSPEFIVGRSVFRERVPLWKRILLGRKERNIVIYLEGANRCFELHNSVAKELESNQSHLWNKEEKEKYINKLVAKSKIEQRLISTTHFLIICGLLGAVLVLQFLIARGIRIF